MTTRKKIPLFPPSEIRHSNLSSKFSNVSTVTISPPPPSTRTNSASITCHCGPTLPPIGFVQPSRSRPLNKETQAASEAVVRPLSCISLADSPATAAKAPISKINRSTDLLVTTSPRKSGLVRAQKSLRTVVDFGHRFLTDYPSTRIKQLHRLGRRY